VDPKSRDLSLGVSDMSALEVLSYDFVEILYALDFSKISSRYRKEFNR
jgi:hypothetical protein